MARRVASSPSVRFFLDLDETLVHSDRYGTEWPSELEGAFLPCGYSSVIRPGARELVAALCEIAPVWLCTMADGGYAAEVLEAFGLTDRFSGVISYADLKAGTVFDHGGDVAFLIDDLPASSLNTKMKIRAMGRDSGVETVLINVPPFQWDPQDSFLHSVLASLQTETSQSAK